MSKPSWMMLGSSMTVAVTDQGHLMQLRGRVLGFALAADEVVTERTPPWRKVWETIGKPRLLIIAGYRMGFQITPTAKGARLRVFIDYALPAAGLAHFCGRIFAPVYARWCTRRMV